ncbi:uncharacterized protein LOC135157065 [Lytechinus pictus]|uniref:uncharacterized protein LOC135157065 n=1 Tax=Lytechinus pictus TaxID=7653 RepID=UPI0030B9B70F
MAGFEELIDDVLQRLSASTEEQLLKAAAELKLPEEDVGKAKSKGRAGLKRVIRRFLDGDELEDSEDGGKSVLQGLTKILGKGDRDGDENVVEVKARTTKLPREPPTQPKSDQPAEEADDTSQRSPILKMTNQLPHTPVTWRKEFRIQGQIGEPSQKDKLSFVSLARQINSGLKKGFPAEEITEAVVRAVNPGLSLRSYLEGRGDLDLPLLRRLLRSHFRERDATALFQELSSAVQVPKESPHDFVLRTLDLKQKVLFASEEKGAAICYGSTQVHKMAWRAISTGLQDAVIQHELRSTLQQDVSDEELLEVLTTAVAHESERQQKLKPRQARVAAAIAEPAKPETTSKQTSKTEALNLKELTNSIQQIVKAELNALMAQPRGPRSGRRERGCEACQQQGQGESCRHCFRCGSSEHYARRCNMRRQGNGVGLLGRDNQ